MQMDLILSFDSLKRSNFQSVAMVFVLKHADVADLHSADLNRSDFVVACYRFAPDFMGFNYSVTLVKALERPHGRDYRCDRSTEVNTKQRLRAVTAPAGPGQTRSSESGAWYRAGARSLTSKSKRLIYSMWPGEFLDRGISNNKSRLG